MKGDLPSSIQDKTMIRLKTIFGKLFSLKTSDKKLFHSILLDFSPSEAVCPRCRAIGNCEFHGSYDRWLITVKKGKRSGSIVSIPRVICNSCGKTHAILPDILIPHGSYSLRFIINILYNYLLRKSTVPEFCASWGIAVSTLYTWIHLFKSQASLWLGILKEAKAVTIPAIDSICLADSLPSSFLKRFGFSFFQFRSSPSATLSRRKPDSS